MKKYFIPQNRTSVPESFITKGKQRLKQHENTVYMDNGDEFEIELFNPTQNKVMAEIELNGVTLKSGIVLRPGERVFLERFLDTPEKFKFDTYFVNGNNSDVVDAISKNGKVNVKFYGQKIHFNGSSINWNTCTSSWNTFTTPTTNYFYDSQIYIPSTTTGTVTYGTTNANFTSGIVNTSNSFLSQSSISEPTPLRKSKSLETGRVEKGSKSDQSFTYDQTTFNTYSSWTSEWYIKPKSTKPVMKEDLVVYCTECGSKRKKDTFRYCPHCGNKF